MLGIKTQIFTIFLTLFALSSFVKSIYFDLARTKEMCYIDDFYAKSVQ